jgi:hypothetical protein
MMIESRGVMFVQAPRASRTEGSPEPADPCAADTLLRPIGCASPVRLDVANAFTLVAVDPGRTGREPGSWRTGHA